MLYNINYRADTQCNPEKRNNNHGLSNTAALDPENKRILRNMNNSHTTTDSRQDLGLFSSAVTFTRLSTIYDSSRDQEGGVDGEMGRSCVREESLA